MSRQHRALLTVPPIRQQMAGGARMPTAAEIQGGLRAPGGPPSSSPHSPGSGCAQDERAGGSEGSSPPAKGLGHLRAVTPTAQHRGHTAALCCPGGCSSSGMSRRGCEDRGMAVLRHSQQPPSPDRRGCLPPCAPAPPPHSSAPPFPAAAAGVGAALPSGRRCPVQPHLPFPVSQLQLVRLLLIFSAQQLTSVSNRQRAVREGARAAGAAEARRGTSISPLMSPGCLWGQAPAPQPPQSGNEPRESERSHLAPPSRCHPFAMGSHSSGSHPSSLLSCSV